MISFFLLLNSWCLLHGLTLLRPTACVSGLARGPTNEMENFLDEIQPVKRCVPPNRSVAKGLHVADPALRGCVRHSRDELACRMDEPTSAETAPLYEPRPSERKINVESWLCPYYRHFPDRLKASLSVIGFTYCIHYVLKVRIIPIICAIGSVSVHPHCFNHEERAMSLRASSVRPRIER
jgi:hypothetical protein